MEKMELERLQIVDAIKGYKSKSVSHMDHKAHIHSAVFKTNGEAKKCLSCQTIFEINSSSKTPASEVMRAKRSKDTRLVDKFNKQKDNLAAENPLQQPINLTTTDDDVTQSGGREDDDLAVGNSHLSLHILLVIFSSFRQK